MSDRTPDGEATTDGGATADVGRPLGLPRWVTAALPLVLLALVVGTVFVTGLGALETTGEPLPDLTVTHTTLPNDETVLVHVTNNGPDAVTLQQVLVNDAYWAFEVTGGDRTLAPLESATVRIPYHWTPGWDLGIGLVLGGGATVHHTVLAPQPAPGLTGEVLWTLALVGIAVGVVPVALGMGWFPFLRTTSDRWLHAVLAFSAGVLLFLAFDAGFEALELAEAVPGAVEGHLLVVFGAVGTLLGVQAVSEWSRSRGGEESAGLRVAYLVAFGIGLHNLAEGLAIGSAFALGRASLGAFLVIGFMVHNVTEGPAVVAPVAHGERPSLWHFGALGLLAGAPVILGGWIGSVAYSPTLGALFLAIGVGAILQVVWELRGMVRRGGDSAGTARNLTALLVGLGVMYATDLLVVL